MASDSDYAREAGTATAEGIAPSRPSRGTRDFFSRLPVVLFVLTCHLAIIVALIYIRVGSSASQTEVMAIMAGSGEAPEAGVDTGPEDAVDEGEDEPDPEDANEDETVETDEPPTEDPNPGEADPASGVTGMRRGPDEGILNRSYDTRVGEGKSGALNKYGGGSGTENAVRFGLDWLARHQDETGLWSASGFIVHCPPGATECTDPGHDQMYDLGLSGLALLCFVGAGHTHMDGPYENNVELCYEAVLASQRRDGSFVLPGHGGDLCESAHTSFMYDQAVCTLALTELYILTGEPELYQPIANSLKFFERAQQADGGWDYTALRTGRNDLSITGWIVFTLASAVNAGLPVNERMLDRTKKFVEYRLEENGTAVYTATGSIGKNRRGIGMTAVAAVSMMFLGHNFHESPALHKAMDVIIGELPNWRDCQTQKGTFHTMYYWYYGALACFHVGGKYWDKWNTSMGPMLIKHQRKDGCARGSWDPVEYWWGHLGRIYSTAINILNLEVYYRMVPLYVTRGIEPADSAPVLKIEDVAAGLRSGITSVAEKTNLIGLYIALDEDRCAPGPLLEFLESDNQQLRWKAADALFDAGYGGREVAEAFVEALRLEETSLSAFLARCVGSLGQVEDLPVLINTYENTKLESTRTASRNAMAEIVGVDLGARVSAWREYYEEYVNGSR